MFRFIALLFGKTYQTLETEILLKQIERLEAQNKQLFDRLLKLSEPEIIPASPTPVPQKPRIGNWQQQKKELEAQDRVEADILKRKIEEEEKELKIAPESPSTH